MGANYRASCRARSRAEFIAKLGIVEEEADESIYWLELFVESGILRQDRAGRSAAGGWRNPSDGRSVDQDRAEAEFEQVRNIDRIGERIVLKWSAK